MDEQRYTYRVQRWVLSGAALLFVLLLLAWLTEAGNKEWRRVQKAFEKELISRSGQAEAGGELERGIFQIELPQLGRNDRCISCHFGLEDSRMEGAPQPHATHPGDFLDSHPVQDFGCTICHGGQSQALSRVDAFGRDPGTHWPYPLLEQPYIQASCGKCHLSIFEQAGMAASAMEGMEVFIRGKEIFSMEGCLGCHKARGVGGILGPDLTEQGEKTKHEYSFQNVRGEQSVSNWLKEHFRDPEMVSPGSQMLKIDLDEKELDALATFVMGLAKPDIPFDYFSMETLREFKGIRDSLPGFQAFGYLCSSCHGKEGGGKAYENYKTGIPSIGNTDFLRVASKDFIRFTVEKGRSQRQMASWTSAISGLRSGELDDIVLELKNRLPSPEAKLETFPGGLLERGMAQYEKYCQSCHGKEGKGGVAVALNQDGLLAVANDRFLLQTLVYGRGNTAMPGWPQLTGQDLSDLLMAIRSWQSGSASASRLQLPDPDLDEGARRYHFLCSRCHGEFGEGETGPAIINKDFLAAAGDDFLYQTIARGRAHTAMFGWSTDVYNQEKLSQQDIGNIAGFMQAKAGDELSYILPGSNPGNWKRGEGIFAKRCAECHGKDGEGHAAPALHNQEFLSAASNGYLMATMTIGREGTAMPSWGYDRKESPALTQGEREDLVAHIRSWQRIRIKY